MINKIIEKELLFNAVIDSAVAGFIIIDSKGIIQYFSASAEKLFGYSKAECIDKNIGMLMPKEEQKAHDGYLTNYAKTHQGNIIGKGGREVFGKTKTGELFPMHLSVGRTEYQGDVFFVGICHDLTDFKQVQEDKETALKKAAYFQSHDQLTGLLNQTEVIKRFEQWRSPQILYGVLYFDFNHFGLINEKYGYPVGNQILMQAAKRMSKCQPLRSLIARANSDEFVAILPVETIYDIKQIAQKMLSCLESEYLIDGETIRLTGKIGISTYPNDGQSIEEAIRMAATAVIQARSESMSVAYYRTECHENLKRQLDIEQGLKSAIEHNRLEIYLQAKVCLRTEQVIGYEALLRWNDKHLGWVSPVEFISIAEQLNLSITLDRYVLNLVMEYMADAVSMGLEVKPIAVNITSKLFNDPTLAEYIIEQAEQHGIDLSLIELELTEGTLMGRGETQTNNLTMLRNLGVKIAIDDFGTGYSSISYLRNMTIDILKIDKSFIDDIEHEQGRVLVEAILAMSKATGLKVVAEGIETRKQADILKALGCDTGQGYLYARPKPVAQVLFPTGVELPNVS